jgi:hypothetical protein
MPQDTFDAKLKRFADAPFGDVVMGQVILSPIPLDLLNLIDGGIHRLEPFPVPNIHFHKWTVAIYKCLWCGGGLLITRSPLGSVRIADGLHLPQFRNCRGEDS